VGWQDQGRQRHMWFGHGKAPANVHQSGGRAGNATGDREAELASRLVYGAIATLSPGQRMKAEAQLQNGTLAPLTEALAIWLRNAQLDSATFADRFFDRSADDPIAANLHGAVIDASLAPGRTEMRGATEKLAKAIKAIGLDRWPRFIAEAQARAVKVAAARLENATPVPFLDDDGHTILNSDGRPMLRPAGMDPHFFVAQGLLDRPVEEALLSTGNEGGGPATLGYKLGALSHFNRGGAWDAQRVGGSFHTEFVDYATVAIGLYAAADGIPRDEIPEIENRVARDSHYDRDKQMDKTYTHLPKVNVENTDLGIQLYQTGRIAATPPGQ
jgi:hypothetical protein